MSKRRHENRGGQDGPAAKQDYARGFTDGQAWAHASLDAEEANPSPATGSAAYQSGHRAGIQAVRDEIKECKKALAGPVLYRIALGKTPPELALEEKCGLPLEKIPGTVYALHYETPQVVRSVSIDYAGPPETATTDAHGFASARPVRHYVGWTQQAHPRKRINKHGPAALRKIVSLQPGTLADEEALKRSGTCPECGERYALSLWRPQP